MNLLEHHVIEVWGPPERREWDDGAVKCWLVPARVDCYGQIENTKVFCSTAEEAEQVRAGYVYLA